jgi:hypothetical protein
MSDRFTIFAADRVNADLLPNLALRIANLLLSLSRCWLSSLKAQVGMNLRGERDLCSRKSHNLSWLPVMGGGELKMVPNARASKCSLASNNKD